MEPIYDLASAASSVVNVHPLVLFTILDHHIRREAGQDRVIGALLGTNTGGTVEITDAFGVYHTKRGEEEVRGLCCSASSS
jgi:translation initiation factor 3 subunit F